MTNKLLDQYLELRTVMYNMDDDEVTLERYGRYSLQLTGGHLSSTTIEKIRREGFIFFISEGKLVFFK